ncbi:porin family protein [Flavobacterium sp.]|uniref:porin family protein n=1 Tax=Flavobacterium sp. TaxID=239 RepID=UPI0025C42CE3|nr:porin family protein [Flavobacterium sp.]
MKRIFTLLLISSIGSAFAQNKLNAFVGVNYSLFTKGIYKQVSGEQSFGMNIGANYEIPLNPTIAFRPGLNFAQVGDRTKTTGYYENSIKELDTKLSYVNVPMDFKFWNKIYLIAGPQLSVRVNDAPAKRAEIGFNLGTGFTINKLFFEFGIYQGLTPAMENIVDFQTGPYDVHNGYAKFLVGYSIF